MRKNNKLIKEIKKVNKNIVKDAKYVALKIKSLESLEKRYLIVSDLDGTLLRSDNTISKFSELIIKKLVRKGHIFCLSTGRPLRAAVQYYKQLGLNSLLLNFNGSYISNPSDKMFIPLNLGFSNEILRKIFFNKKILQWAKNILVENTEGDFI
jgi:HAD superfamily hydrolase (TIGR01484 family)